MTTPPRPPQIDRRRHGPATAPINARRTAAVVLMILAALLVAASAHGAKKKKIPDRAELFNPRLGVEYSQWLVGPIARMASAEEIERYLRLDSDEKAAAFIEAFWEKRNEDTPIFQDTPQIIFEERVEEADRQFTEGVYPGSHTDRGTIWVLYGKPEKEYREKPRRRDDPVPIVWEYPKDAEPGLDGQPPERRYRFIEFDGQIVFFEESMRNRLRMRNRARPGRPY